MSMPYDKDRDPRLWVGRITSDPGPDAIPTDPFPASALGRAESAALESAAHRMRRVLLLREEQRAREEVYAEMDRLRDKTIELEMGSVNRALSEGDALTVTATFRGSEIEGEDASRWWRRRIDETKTEFIQRFGPFHGSLPLKMPEAPLGVAPSGWKVFWQMACSTWFAMLVLLGLVRLFWVMAT